MKGAILLFVVLNFLWIPVAGQEKAGNLFDLSLEELMNVEISVASKNSTSQRETPGIVNVITSDDIRNSGARDFIDIFKLIPGFDLGFDVFGQVGAGLRGLWAYEGKLLFMVDGLEMQDAMYSSIQFGNHFSVDQIKRIEIIRGPGSSLYGGNAELTVINVITKAGEDIDGGELDLTYGQLSDIYGRRDVNLNAGKKFNDLEINFLGFFGEGNQSSQEFTDIYGSTYDVSDNGGYSNAISANTSVVYKNLKARFLLDNYRQKTISVFDAMADEPFEQSFLNVHAALEYKWEISDKISLTPHISFRNQSPWVVEDTVIYGGTSYKPNNKRTRGGILFNMDASESLSFTAGGEYIYDMNKYNDEYGEDGFVFYNGSKEVSFSNLGLFAQALIKTNPVNITLGIRYDDHSAFESSLSPRIALTKAFDKFHFKLLYSHAFRAPGVENMNNAYNVQPDTVINISPALLPERTRVAEIELGYLLTKDLSVTTNLFYTKIVDPMVYFYDSEYDAEGYYNADQYGSSGIEAELVYKKKWGLIKGGYSYYTLDGINKTEVYSVPGNSSAALAMPQHKITFLANLRAGNHITINPSVIYKSKRYAYTSLDDAGTPADDSDDFEKLEELSPVFLANLYFLYTDLFTKGLDLGLGVYDILGENDIFIQPYNGWHAPFPGSGREFVIKLGYSF